MYGISVLFCVGLYLGIAFFVCSRPKSLLLKSVLVIIFIAIPTWDIIPTRIAFEKECASNTSLSIKKTAHSLGLYEKSPYDFHKFRFPNEDNRNEEEKNKSLKRLSWVFLMHPLRGFLINNGLYLEISWAYNDKTSGKRVYRNGRFWVTDSEDNQCIKDITEEDLHQVNRNFPSSSKSTGKCIAGYPIKEIGAQYVLQERLLRSSRNGVTEYSTIIYDRNSGEELASSSHYYLKKNWVLRILDPHGVSDSCGTKPSCATKILAKNFFENVDGASKPFIVSSPNKNGFCSDSLEFLMNER